ncbi:acyl-CoA dehydrogenase family protein [Mycolicibacterium sp. P1-18]|uniref:acyl-CoA dehydrogenase family protein n=1 Tax=Mycolicibacterium sp. P1-18 TaxID=2024615 RepID=UPI001F5BF346|nr:acyl-CoA dehydrogenase family protein [Mycolicibacterium sp. P1-18]
MTTVETTPTTVDPALIEMMDAVLGAHRHTRTPAGAFDHDEDLWRRLDELGLVRLTGPESKGGSGAGWLEAAALLTAAVRHGVRIPVAEHDLLACWLLDANDMAYDDAVRTVAVLDQDGTATAVPWARSAQRIVVVWRVDGGYRLTDAPIGSVVISARTNPIGEPRDSVTADVSLLDGVPVSDQLVDQLVRKAALIRAIQVCAALDSIVESSIEHAGTRVQFGRTLSKFQTMQNLISDSAAEAALARSATEAALTAAVADSWATDRLDFMIAVARSCAGHAATVVVRNGHQIHGAIGTTREHQLHEFTRAALAWRSDYGSVDHWDAVITDAALAAGGRGLWSLITA